ncbi:Fc.00g086480.m01.CDS01 [Cosmosporella sp. VM-42]
MAFQSSVLRDGQWVTETVNLQDALKASVAPKPVAIPQAEPPKCAILSRTIIESPIVHWVLPVRLRSQSRNDIAFIGDRFVQISELRADGQVHEIIRKSDFGTRIRNAVVFGGSPQDGTDDDASGLIKTEDSDVFMQGSANVDGDYRPRTLPPQLLILMLETGDAIFLFIRERADGRLEFVTTKYACPRNLKYLGFHLSIDPTSRYMAAASTEGAFIVYELESPDRINSQYLQNGSFKPIRSFRVRSIKAIIHKLEFLHPRPEDDYHIILVLILIRNDGNGARAVSRMVTYEWELGDELKSVFAEVKLGTRLPEEHKMPLLLIPLRFKTAFFAVSQNSIGIVKCTLSGSPEFESLQTDAPGSTKLHHGTYDPLWTAWARPFRRKQYLKKTDIIYLAREDGVIVHIEIDSAYLVPSVTNVGSLDTNITTAFTTAFDIFSDVLIIGGDSGPGGIWKLPARSDLEQVATIPNWSPVIDFVTTDEHQSWKAEAALSQGILKHRTPTVALCKPDRIFCTSGRGPKSSVTELRWGIQARVGLDIDYDQPVRQSWMFPMEVHGDLAQGDAVSSEAAPFDLDSRTIYAVQNEQGTIIQITETSTTLVAPSQSSRHPHEQVCGLSSVIVENAFCKDDIVVFFAHYGQRQQIHILRIEQMNITHACSWDIPSSVTCISMFSVSGKIYIAAGSINNHGSPIMLIYSLDGREIASIAVEDDQELGSEPHYQMEAFTSICVLPGDGESGVKIVYGTRSGHLVTSRVPDEGPEQISFSVERLGMAPTNVFLVSSPFDGKITAFVCCDNNLVLLTDFSQRSTTFKTKNFVWPTDVNDPSMPSPPIHSVYCLQDSLSGYRGHMSLMLLAGSRILLADIWPYVGPVPRSIPLDGTPMRVIFSQTWKCLVVAHLKKDLPTLSFIDPDSGATISDATSSERALVDYISGLGHQGDMVYGLYEWRFARDGMTFPFIIVTTRQGRLMIVSVQETRIQNSDGPARRLQYWTRYKKKGFNLPVHSVVGGSEGLIFCVGDVLHWEVLDLTEKKLKPMKQFKLESPATSLRVENGKVFALTAAHSLQVIDLHMESSLAEMSLLHSDQVTRYTSHLVDVGDSVEKPGEWPITLLSTTNSGFAGVWIPWGLRNKEFLVTFYGTLPASIRRFRRGHTRPIWVPAGRQKLYGCLSSTVDGAEILGVSLDGSLQHFTLLSPGLWRFLRLIQNLAHCSTTVCPFTHRGVPESGVVWSLEPQPAIDMLHVDGDILKRCLDLEALESLSDIGDGFGFDRFREYLDTIDDGAHTKGFDKGSDEGKKKYFELGYGILEYVLAPVF